MLKRKLVAAGEAARGVKDRLTPQGGAPLRKHLPLAVRMRKKRPSGRQMHQEAIASAANALCELGSYARPSAGKFRRRWCIDPEAAP